MKLKIEIDMDNAAFGEDLQGEVASILSRIPVRLGSLNEGGEDRIFVQTLRDTNGNTVGFARIKE
jgi:hypothetical protein